MSRSRPRGLSIGAVLAWASALFAIPLLVLMGLLLWRAWGDIQLAQRQARGLAYLQQIWPAMSATDRDLGPTQPAFDLEFGTSEAADTFLRAFAVDTRLKAGAQLVADVADGSGLNLDPELGEAHLVDALTVRLPAVINAGTELSEVAQIRDADQPARLAVALDHLQAAADQAQSALQAAMKYDASGVTHSVLDPHLAGLAAAARDLAARGQAVGSGGDPNAVSTARAGLQWQVNGAWQACQGELDRLIAARITRLGERLAAELALVLALLIVAGAVTARMAAGLTRQIADLAATGEQLAANQIYLDVPHAEAPGAVGRLAEALSRLKHDLIDRNLRRYDADDHHKALAAKLAEAQAAMAAAQTERRGAIDALGAALKRLGQGDLTINVEGELAADFQGLKTEFNTAIGLIREALTGVAGEAEAIAREVDQMARSTDDLTRGKDEQAVGLQAATSSIGTLSDAARETLAEARRAGGVVGAAKGEAQRGDAIVRQAAGAMDQISQLAQQVNQIVGVMDEIAFQTNLLALNAGVEAARSGEAGRGFAVVAQEVRALAQRSAVAAKEIRALIAASANQVGAGVELVDQTSQALARVLGQVAEIDTVVARLAAAAETQAGGLAEIGAAVGRVDRSAEGCAEALGQQAAAAKAVRLASAELSGWMEALRLAPPARPSLRPKPVEPPAFAAPVIQLRDARGAVGPRRPFSDLRPGRRFERGDDE